MGSRTLLQARSYRDRVDPFDGPVAARHRPSHETAASPLWQGMRRQSACVSSTPMRSTGMPEGTVKNYIFRGRKLLKEKVLKYIGKEELS